jgi:hypothetical protein
MLVRQQPLDRRISHHRQQEPNRDIPGQQAFAVLGEHRHVPHWGVHRQADEPAKQHVVGDLLHELALRTHPVEGLQQERPQ